MYTVWQFHFAVIIRMAIIFNCHVQTSILLKTESSQVIKQRRKIVDIQHSITLLGRTYDH